MTKILGMKSNQFLCLVRVLLLVLIVPQDRCEPLQMEPTATISRIIPARRPRIGAGREHVALSSDSTAAARKDALNV